MALFVPVLTKCTHTAQCVEAAELLLRAIGYGGEAGSWLVAGIGIDAGVAFVGNVGSGDVKDFTAIGDVVNVASRLQGAAKAGQIVLSERTYAHVSDRFPAAPSVELQLKAKEQPVTARVLDLSPAAVWVRQQMRSSAAAISIVHSHSDNAAAIESPPICYTPAGLRTADPNC